LGISNTPEFNPPERQEGTSFIRIIRKLEEEIIACGEGGPVNMPQANLPRIPQIMALVGGGIGRVSPREIKANLEDKRKTTTRV